MSGVNGLSFGIAVDARFAGFMSVGMFGCRLVDILAWSCILAVL